MRCLRHHSEFWVDPRRAQLLFYPHIQNASHGITGFENVNTSGNNILHMFIVKELKITESCTSPTMHIHLVNRRNIKVVKVALRYTYPLPRKGNLWILRDSEFGKGMSSNDLPLFRPLVCKWNQSLKKMIRSPKVTKVKQNLI